MKKNYVFIFCSLLLMFFSCKTPEIENYITYTFDANGGTWEDGSKTLVLYGKPGEKINTVSNPVYETEEVDYKFVSWDKDIPETFGEEDLSFKANWQVDKRVYAFYFYKQNLSTGEFEKIESDTVYKKCPVIYSHADIDLSDYYNRYENFIFYNYEFDYSSYSISLYYKFISKYLDQ